MKRSETSTNKSAKQPEKITVKSQKALTSMGKLMNQRVSSTGQSKIKGK